MKEYQPIKRRAIRFWEIGRIVYNLFLLMASTFAYSFKDALNWVGDPHVTHWDFILPYFLVSVVGANVCYNSAYVFEFFFLSLDPASWWNRFGRIGLFVLGLGISVLLALVAGMTIADLEWEHGAELLQ